MELNVSGLRKTYKGIDGEPDFFFDIPAMNFELSQVIFIMGSNGSGKSVFLKLMAGEILPSDGYINFVLGDEVWKAHKRPSAIVRQKAEESLAVDLTVRENLLLRISPNSLLDRLFPSKRLNTQAQDLVKIHSELLRKLDQPSRNLSGGQRQVLAFLVTASQKLPVLFLDEFLAATDQKASRLLRQLARDYAERVPACVFIVSHDTHMALEDADRILVINGGQLIEDLRRGDSEWNETHIASLFK